MMGNQRPPDKTILEAVRRRMLSSGDKQPTNKQLLKENIYGDQSQMPPPGVASGGGLMDGLGGVSSEPDPRFQIAPNIQTQYNPMTRNV